MSRLLRTVYAIKPDEPVRSTHESFESVDEFAYAWLSTLRQPGFAGYHVIQTPVAQFGKVHLESNWGTTQDVQCRNVMLGMSPREADSALQTELASGIPLTGAFFGSPGSRTTHALHESALLSYSVG